MYKDTITLFCMYSGRYYRPYVLKGVDLNVSKSAIIAERGVDTGDRAKLHIKGYDKIGPYTYVDPKAYTGTATTITFASGNEFSFFIIGEYATTVIDDEDYTEGFYNSINKSRDCFAITDVARYSVIPHFEVIAK